MPRLLRVTSRKLLAALLRAGFYVHHQTGSHINLKHRTKLELHVVIPMHNANLAPKTLKSIIVQAELTSDELRELL